MWILEAIAQDAPEPRTFALPAGTFLVGRKDEPSTHIVILNDKAISREHAKIVVEPLPAAAVSTAVAQATLLGALRKHTIAIGHSSPPPQLGYRLAHCPCT